LSRLIILSQRRLPTQITAAEVSSSSSGRPNSWAPETEQAGLQEAVTNPKLSGSKRG